MMRRDLLAMRLYVFGILLIGSVATAWANDVYVSPAGNDAGAGTEYDPYATLTHALAQVQPPAVIHLAEGTYGPSSGESLPWVWNTPNALSIIGAGSARTIMTGEEGNRLLVLINSTRVRFEGVTLTSANSPWGSALNATLVGMVEMRDCIVSNNYSGPFGGAFVLDRSSITAVRCVFSRNQSDQSGGAIWLSGGAGAFTNVLFSDNIAPSGQGTLHLNPNYGESNPGSLVLDQCTFANNSGNGGGCFLNGMYDAARIVARNSIFWGNGDAPAAAATLRYCDIEGNDTLGAYGCINRDPLFADTAYYHLQSLYGQYEGGFFDDGAFAAGTTNSPCIDAGDPAVLPSGEPAPTGVRVNLGAYGNTGAASKSPPLSVAVNDATDVSVSSATLRGELLGVGGPNVRVWFYWGTAAGVWTHSAVALDAANAPQAFSLAVADLPPQSACYFTCFASNASGETAWAPTTNSFESHLTAPAVANRGVENERGPVVTLKGEVTDDGGDLPDVYVCWGLTAGSGSTGSWENVVAMGQRAGAFSTDIATVPGADYVYTCYATNGAGGSWATPAIAFGASSLRYVNPAATGNGDGRSWENAYTNLLAALAACDAGYTNTLCLAGGTYSLTQTAWMTNSHVFVRGGYAGVGAPGARDTALHATVIRNGSGGSLRLWGVRAAADVLIDGLTLTGGQLPADNFAGLLIENATNVTVRGCTVRNGTAGTAGGGVGVVDSTGVAFDRCMISNNTCSTFGGGVYLTNSAAVFTGCTIQKNGNSGEGAGVWIEGGSLDMIDCVIAGNAANNGTGGGLCAKRTAARLRNGLVAFNDAYWVGDGLLIMYGGTMTLENCTVLANKGDGVALYNNGYDARPVLTVSNSILWKNSYDLRVWGDYYTVQADHSDIGTLLGVGDASLGAGCLRTDPLLAYRHGAYLEPGSACVDAGGLTAAAAGLAEYTTRADGTADAGPVDMGYHYPAGTDLATLDVFVSPSGSDAAAGTEGAPFKSITRALRTAGSGATIHLAAGVYSAAATGESFPLTWMGGPQSGIAIVGTNSARTVISGAGQSLLFYLKEVIGVAIEGVTLTGANGDWGGVVNAESLGCLELLDCVATNNHANNGGVLCMSSVGLSARRCVFNNNSAGGACGAMYLPSCTVAFENVLMAGNSSAYAPAGMAVFNGGTMSIANSTFANHNGVALQNNNGVIPVRNSIFWGNADDMTGAFTLSYCVSADGAAENGCTTNDPLFQDAAFYHLQSRGGCYLNGFFTGGTWGRSAANSPCLDAGDPASAYANEPDFNGRRINLGAYANTDVASRAAHHGTLVIIN